MSNIKLKGILVDNTLNIQNGNVVIYDTSDSITPVSGALVVTGGVGIANTNNSTSSTGGGCLNLSGGVSINKNIYIGGDINQDSSFSTFVLKGISNDRIKIDSVSNKRITLAPNGVDINIDINDTYAYINYTKSSTNSTTGALVSYGGMSINNTSDSTSVTSGGALTINGGASIKKSVYIGENLYVSNCTIANIITTNGNIGINTTSPTKSLDINGDLAVISSTIGNLYINSDFNVNNEIYKANNQYNISSSSLVLSQTPFVLKNQDDNYTSFKNFNSILEINYNTNGVLFISTNGNIGINTSTPSKYLDINGDLKCTNATIENLFTSNANILQLSTGTLINNNLLCTNSTFTNIYTQNITSSSINVSNITSSSLLSSNANITNGNISNITTTNMVNTNMINTNITSTSIHVTNFTSTSINTQNVITNQLTSSDITKIITSQYTIGNIYYNSGSIGINTTNSNISLYVNGDFQAVNTTVDSLLSNNQIYIKSTENASSNTSGGALTIDGGTSILKNLYVGGNIYSSGLDIYNLIINSTLSSSNSTTGAIVSYGGISINNTSNSTSVTSGGALTINGGLSVNKNTYFGKYITIVDTELSTNSSSGSIICYGGLGINNSANSSNVSNGGAMTIKGGCSVGKDIYIGGSSYMYGKSIYNSNNNIAIQLNDPLNIRSFSINLDTSSNDFSVERYDTNGDFLQKCYQISYNTGNITFYNSENSFNGNITINSTSNSCLIVYGGMNIYKQLNSYNDIKIFSTTSSNSVSTGSLIVNGGVGINENLNVLGNTTINGNLYVSGTTTTINSNTVSLLDNILLLNSGPSGTKDAGINIQRYQVDNDSGYGDVVSDDISFIDSIPLQTGIASNEVKLSSSANNTNSYYNGWWIKVSSGFSANQVRQITGYDGTTKIATLSSIWTSQNPSIGDVLYLYKKSYIGLFFNEINNIFEFGSLSLNPTDNISLNGYSDLKISKLYCLSTEHSNNMTTGALISYGGITITDTQNSSSVTSGGAMTVYGGVGVYKDSYFGGNVYINNINIKPNQYDVYSPKTFNATNNTTQNISNISFDSGVYGFDIYLVANLIADTNMYTNYNIRGVNKNTSWELVSNYVGDDLGLSFNIDNSGQISYSSINYAGFVSLTFRFRIITV